MQMDKEARHQLLTDAVAKGLFRGLLENGRAVEVVESHLGGGRYYLDSDSEQSRYHIVTLNGYAGIQIDQISGNGEDNGITFEGDELEGLVSILLVHYLLLKMVDQEGLGDLGPF